MKFLNDIADYISHRHGIVVDVFKSTSTSYPMVIVSSTGCRLNDVSLSYDSERNGCYYATKVYSVLLEVCEKNYYNQLGSDVFDSISLPNTLGLKVLGYKSITESELVLTYINIEVSDTLNIHSKQPKMVVMNNIMEVTK